MFTQFRYTQDFGFGILLTEATEFVDKPFPLTTTLPLVREPCHRPLGRSDLGQRTLNLELGLRPIEPRQSRIEPRLRRSVIDEDIFDVVHFMIFID